VNIGPTQWVNHFGVEWPAGTHRLLAALNVAKKWRLLEARGETLTASPGDCMEEAVRALLPSVALAPWTKTMLHESVMHEYYNILGCSGLGKSYFFAAYALMTWIPDPFTTTVIMASSTLKELSARSWSNMLTLFGELKNNKLGFDIPGRSMASMYSVINERDASIAESNALKSGILGRGLEEGRLHGLHNRHVRFLVDELSLIEDVDALKQAMSNIRTGTQTFGWLSAANPKEWSHPTSCFYLPPAGVKVTPSTGGWFGATGHWNRHFSGYDSPVVKDPSLKEKYTFLMSQDDIDRTLAECGGDTSHPRMWKMIVGFPRDAGTSTPTVLDPLIAAANKVTEAPEPPLYGERRQIGMAAGVDPSWSANGDTASYAGVNVFEQNGQVTLDFTGRISRLPISTDSPLPVTRQLRDGVVARMRADGGPDIRNMYFDSSGNQSLADFCDVYIGPGCGHINNSARASDSPIRNLDARPAREHIKDRGTESWLVLAEFCRAGMVRGLPQAALEGLTQRRFALRPNSSDPCTPLRLEPKEEFSKRFKGSPDDTDACALAALAVKERLGVVPFGRAPVPEASALFPNLRQEAQQFISTEAPPESAFETDFSEVGAYD
jgi:hypothetical protein